MGVELRYFGGHVTLEEGTSDLADYAAKGGHITLTAGAIRPCDVVKHRGLGVSPSCDRMLASGQQFIVKGELYCVLGLLWVGFGKVFKQRNKKKTKNPRAPLLVLAAPQSCADIPPKQFAQYIPHIVLFVAHYVLSAAEFPVDKICRTHIQNLSVAFANIYANTITPTKNFGTRSHECKLFTRRYSLLFSCIIFLILIHVHTHRTTSREDQVVQQTLLRSSRKSNRKKDKAGNSRKAPSSAASEASTASSSRSSPLYSKDSNSDIVSINSFQVTTQLSELTLKKQQQMQILELQRAQKAPPPPPIYVQNTPPQPPPKTTQSAYHISQ